MKNTNALYTPPPHSVVYFFPSHLLRMFALLSLPPPINSRNSGRRSQSRRFYLLPTTVLALEGVFIATIIRPDSSLDDSHRVPPVPTLIASLGSICVRLTAHKLTLSAAGALLSVFLFASHLSTYRPLGLRIPQTNARKQLEASELCGDWLTVLRKQPEVPALSGDWLTLLRKQLEASALCGDWLTNSSQAPTPLGVHTRTVGA